MSNTGWVTTILRAGLHLVLEAADLFVDIADPGLAPTPMTNRRGRADGVAADVHAAVEIVHDVDQPDGIHVEDGGCVRIVAQLGRVTGDADEVVDAEGARAQQVRSGCRARCGRGRCNAARLDADSLLRSAGTGPGCPCAREARGLSGMFTASMPTPPGTCALDLSRASHALGRHDLHHGDELA